MEPTAERSEGRSFYRLLDHTADFGVVVSGRSPADVYAGAACAMFDQISRLEAIQPTLARTVEVTGDDPVDLLITWLTELHYLFETEELLFARFEVLSLSATSLTARCHGEPLDRQRHPTFLDIKAVTYHLARVEEVGEGVWEGLVIFDI